jgi:K+-transporting ATPase KdpF subunit
VDSSFCSERTYSSVVGGPVTPWDWFALLVCIGLFVYLVAALARPDLFD